MAIHKVENFRVIENDDINQYEAKAGTSFVPGDVIVRDEDGFVYPAINEDTRQFVGIAAGSPPVGGGLVGIIDAIDSRILCRVKGGYWESTKDAIGSTVTLTLEDGTYRIDPASDKGVQFVIERIDYNPQGLRQVQSDVVVRFKQYNVPETEDVTVTEDYTASPNEDIWLDTTNGPFTLNLANVVRCNVYALAGDFETNPVTITGTRSGTDVIDTNGGGGRAARAPDDKVDFVPITKTLALVPLISTIAPNSGSILGDNVVVITGENFTDEDTVTFNGIAATSVTFVNDTTLEATAPESVSSGAVDIKVSNSVGEDTSASGYTYQILAPILTALNLVTGTTAGGDVITLTGGEFRGDETVLFGLMAASGVTRLSRNTLEATTPPGVVGFVDVEVNNAGGLVILPGAYEYV